MGRESQWNVDSDVVDFCRREGLLINPLRYMLEYISFMADYIYGRIDHVFCKTLWNNIFMEESILYPVKLQTIFN